MSSAPEGLWFRQLLPGRDIALRPKDKRERLIFDCAARMQNFIYLVGDASSKDCFVVDGCWDIEGIAAYAEAEGKRLVGAVATHYHWDHAGGNVPQRRVAMVFGPFDSGPHRLPGLYELARQHGVTAYIHEADAPAVAAQSELGAVELTAVSNGQRIHVSERISLECMATPGHTPGSMCLLVHRSPGKDCAETAAMALSGDTIFPGSCGRLDFDDSDVHAMHGSLEALRSLPDHLPVYPGHAYGGASTTIGREKTSGLLRPFTLQQWLATMR